jgi:hypothetical protein
MKRIAVATSALVMAVTTGCGGGGPSYPGSSYGSPTAMLSKVQAGGFACDPKGAKIVPYNFGGTFLSCFHGPKDLPVYLVIYPSTSDEKSDQLARQAAASAPGAASSANPPQLTYYGNKWEVTTEKPAALAALKKILVTS